MRDKQRARRLAAEVRKHRDDAGEWSEESVDIAVSSSRSIVVSFRLPSAEFYAVQGAAKAARESLSEFIRKALDLRLRGEPAPVPSLEITSGAYRLQTNMSSAVLPARRTENPTTPDVPDEPLKYVTPAPGPSD